MNLLLPAAPRHFPIIDHRIAEVPEVRAACLCGWRDEIWCAAHEVAARRFRTEHAEKAA